VQLDLAIGRKTNVLKLKAYCTKLNRRLPNALLKFVDKKLGLALLVLSVGSSPNIFPGLMYKGLEYFSKPDILGGLVKVCCSPSKAEQRKSPKH